MLLVGLGDGAGGGEGGRRGIKMKWGYGMAGWIGNEVI